MKKLLVPLLSLAATALLVAGCVHGGAYEPVNATKYDLENRAAFVEMDPGAQRSVTCSGSQITPLPDGRLQVVAHVRNRENRRLQVQINCEFKDVQGFVVDSLPWQTLILTENAQEDVPFVSANTKAVKYTVRVREAR